MSRSKQMLVRWSPDEHAAIEARARAEGLRSGAAWLRAAGRERLADAAPVRVADERRALVVMLGDAVRELHAAINACDDEQIMRRVAALAEGYGRLRAAALEHLQGLKR